MMKKRGMKSKGYRNGGKIMKPKGMRGGGKVMKPKGMKNGGKVGAKKMPVAKLRSEAKKLGYTIKKS